jgi:S1-C subfamily serine protease
MKRWSAWSCLMLCCPVVGASAADWRALPAPAGVQALLDLTSVTTHAGMQQMLIRREYFTLRAGPAATRGVPFRSMRVNYDIDCATRRGAPTLTAWYGDDRRLIASERHARLTRAALPAVDSQGDVIAAIDMACEKLGAAAPFDAQPARRGDSSGSGIVITQDGHILTNQHVVQQCEELKVSDDGSPPHRAQLIVADAWRDLALIKVDRRFAQAARLRADTTPRLGEAVAVTGYPLVGVLGAKPTVGFGHVSSTTGINDNPAQMQISVPIQRGNSGGPVFDQAGQVMGVVASKLDALKIAESVGDLPQNVNFAVRGDTMRAFLDAQRVDYASTRQSVRIDNTELAAHGVAVTVRVHCVRGEALKTQ